MEAGLSLADRLASSSYHPCLDADTCGISSSPPSDCPVSSLDAVQSTTFDPGRLDGLAPSLLLDLVALSGVDTSEQDPTPPRKTSQQDTTSLRDRNLIRDSSESVTNRTEDSKDAGAGLEGQTQSGVSRPETDAPIAAEQYVGGNGLTRTAGETDSPNHQPRQKTSTESFASSRSVDSELGGVADSVIKVCALKTLLVLMRAPRLFDLLAGRRNPALQPDEAGRDSSSEQDLLKVLQVLVRRVVSTAALPSPIKRVVTLAELDRAQAVLLRKAVVEQGTQDDGPGPTQGARCWPAG